MIARGLSSALLLCGAQMLAGAGGAQALAAGPTVTITPLRSVTQAPIRGTRPKVIAKLPVTKDDYRAPQDDADVGGNAGRIARTVRALEARQVQAGGAAVVYRNTLNLAEYAPGAGILVADDLTSNCVDGGELTVLEFAVGGGGSGSGPGFAVDFELYDACPGAGGQPIADSAGTAGFDDDDTYIVTMDFDGLGVELPNTAWLALTLSSDAAFVLSAGPAEIGVSEDLIHVDSGAVELSCNAWFGGYPNAPHASFYAILEQLACASEPRFVGFRSDVFSGQFYGGISGGLVADDLTPVLEDCQLARLDVEYAGIGGPYQASVELRKDASGLPGDTIAGSGQSFAGLGDGSLESFSFTFDPPIAVPGQLWITHADDSPDAGPVVSGGPATVGQSADAFAEAFGAGGWQALFFGGCQSGAQAACGTFNATLWCAGQAPDVLAACCATSGCVDLTQSACSIGGGQWQSGRSCADGGEVCENAACANGSGDCFNAHAAAGCEDPACCAGVCANDDFCCSVEWDTNCAALAGDLCVPVSNDQCADAERLVPGPAAFDTLGATDDGPLLPASCDEGFGVEFGSDVWYEFTPHDCGTVTASTCDLADFDTRLAVYAGCDCPVDNERLVGCNDDGENCAGFTSRVTFDIEAQQCYKIRLGGYDGAAGTGDLVLTYNEEPCETPCPAGVVNFLSPASGVVDARQPHAPADANARLGISELTVEAPTGADKLECWSLCEGAGRNPNSLVDVEDLGDGTLKLTLARPISAGAVTTVSYISTGASAELISHPANVNGDGVANSLDVLALIDHLNGVSNMPWGTYSTDVDHSNLVAPADIIAVTDLLNGAGAFEPWDQTALPTAANCP